MIHLANFWLYNTIIVLSWRFLANHINIMPIIVVLLYYPEACSQYLAGPEPVKGLFSKPVHDNPNGSFLHFYTTHNDTEQIFFFRSQVSLSEELKKWTYNFVRKKRTYNNNFRNFSRRCTHVLSYNLQVRISKLVQALSKQQNKQRRALFGCFQQKERCIDLTILMMCYYFTGKLLWLLMDTRTIDPTQKGVRS